MINTLNIMYTNFKNLNYKNIIRINPEDNLHIIGVFDETDNIWYNGWCIFINRENYRYWKKSRDLLKYSINMDIDMNYLNNINIILRSILINSKIYLTDKDLQIDVILSIITYLLKAKSYSILKKYNLTYYIIESSSID